MTYQISKRTKSTLAVANVTEALKLQGFGIVTSIDLTEVLKQEPKYHFPQLYDSWCLQSKICTPGRRHRTAHRHHASLQSRGAGHENREVELSAINPLETMDKTVANSKLNGLAKEVSQRLGAAIDALS